MIYIKKPKKILPKRRNFDDMTFKEFVVKMEKMHKLNARVGKVSVKTGGKYGKSKRNMERT